MSDSTPTYGDLRTGDRVIFDDRPPHCARKVASVQHGVPAPNLPGDTFSIITCTDGYCAEVFSHYPLRIPRSPAA